MATSKPPRDSTGKIVTIVDPLAEPEIPDVVPEPVPDTDTALRSQLKSDLAEQLRSDKPVNTPPAETPAEAYARQLEEQLRETTKIPDRTDTGIHPVDERGAPLPESQLSPDQRRIRQLEDQLARAQGQRDPEVQYEPIDGDTFLIHILEDGFTALDRMWYKGQEIEFVVEGRAWNDTKDRNGNTWLVYTDRDQMQRWGRIMFRPGPWPGADYDDDSALSAERKRNRQAPTLPIR